MQNFSGIKTIFIHMIHAFIHVDKKYTLQNLITKGIIVKSKCTQSKCAQIKWVFP
ncbi:4284_t:CDS:2 [Racocetra fulgida]|uniref:4284_t:CDS:1 n=1 Tax=Racocetra fulgida TaxID=60492 RepID=A0A9N8WHE1_9GLOM|nr:4284_t:CDS:2 [Racocetra fulgida]